MREPDGSILVTCFPRQYAPSLKRLSAVLIVPGPTAKCTKPGAVLAWGARSAHASGSVPDSRFPVSCKGR